MAQEYKVKVAILGNPSVGKTCIIERFVNNIWGSTETTVVGTFKSKVVYSPKKTFSIRFNVWDTVGQEIYKSVTSHYYKDADAIILVYDITQPKTFEALSSWYKEIQDNAPPHCLLSAIGNKCDLAETANHDLAAAQAYAQSINARYYLSTVGCHLYFFVFECLFLYSC